MTTLIDLSKETILVTGATGEIGKATCLDLEEHGAKVIRHGLSREADIQADLSEFSGCLRLWESVLKDAGSPTAIVNNAGICEYSPVDLPAMEWSVRWDRIMRVNLKSAADLTRLALENEHPMRIVYVSSRAAFRGDTPELMAYAASKAGMVALAKSVARGFGGVGVRTFVVAPGPVAETPMCNADEKRYGYSAVWDDISTPRTTTPSDVSRAILACTSGLLDQATGTTIDVNGASYVQ